MSTTPQRFDDADIRRQVEQSVHDLPADVLAQMEGAAPPAPAVEGGKVRGVVMDVRGPDVFIHVGGKSEGIIRLDEFPVDKPPKMGQVLDLVLHGADPESGLLRLSFGVGRRPDDAESLKVGDVVKARVTGTNIGGLELRVNGVRAFMPMSQVDLHRLEDFHSFLNQWLECEVMEVNRRGKGLVLSRRRLLERSRDADRERVMTEIEIGQTRMGTVRRLTDFGAFVDIGQGIEGLLHVSDMSYSRVEKPADVLKEGQQVEVKILKLDREKNRIGLGIKQLAADPWETIASRVHAGDTLTGTITKLMNFGAFVEIEPGVEGLLPVSELSWTQRVHHPKDVVKAGDAVRVAVLTVDPDKKKLSLSLKAMSADPWKTISDRYAPETKVSGAVTRVTDFGAFVQLEEGVEGLVHVSQLSDQRIRHPSDVVKPGQVVEARVLSIDAGQRRIGLSLKPAATAELHMAAAPASGKAGKKKRPLRGGLD